MMKPSRYGRAMLAPHIGGTPMRRMGRGPESMMPDAPAIPLNQISGTIKAGADAVKAIGDTTAKIMDSSAEIVELQHAINKENGALANEIQTKLADRQKQVQQRYDDLSSERWTKYGSFTPKINGKSLDLKRRGISKDLAWAAEREDDLKKLSKQFPPEQINMMFDANDDLRSYAANNFGYIDDNGQFWSKADKRKQDSLDKKQELLDVKIDRLKQAAEEQDVKLPTDFYSTLDEKETIMKTKGKGMMGGGMPRRSALTRQQKIGRIYPNPDMMSGMMSK